MRTGKLVVIEGTDGSGKTTQINLLSQYLKSKNIDFEVISFPQYGKNEYAKKVSEYLAGKLTGNIREIANYYAEDRKTAKDEILNWLEEGKLVISNRYVSSSKAHLSANLPDSEREEFVNWIDELEYEENQMPREDLTILLNVDPKVGQENIKDRNLVDIHEQDLNHLDLARQIFLKLAAENNWVIVECMEEGKMKSPEDIQKDLLNNLSMILSPS